MDEMPIVAVVFQSIPESIILFSFGIAIVGERIIFEKVFIAAVISAFTSMFVREYIPYFGLHSLIGILVLFILFWKLLGLKGWKALISSLLSLTVLILLEIFILQAILNLKHITLSELLQDNFKRVIYTYPHLAIFGLFTWLIYYKEWFLIKGSRASNVE